MRLTKKRLSELNLALSLDDILYEKFKRLDADLHRKADSLIRNRKRLWRVIKRGKKYDECLQVIDVQEGPDGMLVVVR